MFASCFITNTDKLNGQNCKEHLACEKYSFRLANNNNIIVLSFLSFTDVKKIKFF